MSWYERWRQRQDELARGVDADLIRDNRRRFKVGLGLLALSFALGWLGEKLQLRNALSEVLFVLIAIVMCLGMVILTWAERERRFLRRPAPEEPPSILKG